MVHSKFRKKQICQLRILYPAMSTFGSEAKKKSCLQTRETDRIHNLTRLLLPKILQKAQNYIKQKENCSEIGSIQYLCQNVCSTQSNSQTQSIKIPMLFSSELEKTITKFIWRQTRFRIPKAVLCKKNEVEDIIMHDFKTCDKTTVIKTAQYKTASH